MITVVLPSRNEALLLDTCRWMLEAGADEIVVVDDASSPPVPASQDIRVRVIRNPSPMGPAFCRNLGLKEAGGSIIIFSDAHVRPDPGALATLAMEAEASGTVVGGACRAMDGQRDWTGYGGVICEIGDGGYDVRYNREPGRRDKVTGFIGSVYAATRGTWDKVGGWPMTLSWGYNEQALSLAVLYSGLKPMASEAVFHHKFKKVFNYPMSSDTSRVNRFAVHFQLMEDPEPWLARLSRQFPREAALWRQEHASRREEWERRRASFQALRNLSDLQVHDIICSWDLSVVPFSANRIKDGQKEEPRELGRVALVCAFAPGREACLSTWVRHVEASGYPIDHRIFILDSPRPDVEMYARSCGAVVWNRPPLASRDDSVATANHLAGHWNMVLPELRKFDFILSVEDDVYPAPGYLLRLLDIQRSQPRIGVVGAAVRSRKDGHVMAYPLKEGAAWDIDTKAAQPEGGRRSVASVSLCCTLIRSSCLPKGFEFTGQPGVDAEGNPSGRRGHEFSLCKAVHEAGYKVVADHDMVVRHEVLEQEVVWPTPPADVFPRESFHRQRLCTSRHHCLVCRTSQVWRDAIRQQYRVHQDFDHLCPEGIKGPGRTLPEMAASAARAIGQAIGRVAAGQDVVASGEAIAERWRRCKACEWYDKEARRCKSCGCWMEVKVTLAASSCDLGKWGEEEGSATKVGCRSCGKKK